MTIEIFENGSVWRDGLDKYQEALFYTKLAKEPDQGISARQIKASIDRRSVKIESVGEDEDDKTN